MTYDIVTTETVTRKYSAWIDENTVKDLNMSLHKFREEAPILDLQMVIAALTDRALPILDTELNSWYTLRHWIIEAVRDEAFNGDCDDLDSDIEYYDCGWDLTSEEQELVQELKPFYEEEVETDESDNG